MAKFRDESYRKQVFIGKRTVKDGEQVVRWNLIGESKVVIGPRRKFFYRSTIQFMTKHTASPTEYLAVVNNDGTVSHERGPCSMFCNPVQHKRITVQKAVKVNPSQAVVVFKRVADNRVERRVVAGPVMFFPEPNEWLAEFSWHGPKLDDPHRYVAKGRSLVILSTLNEAAQMHIHDARTNDDVLLTLDMKVSYQLVDIEKMLEVTGDPVGDLINAITADVIAFTAARSFEGFIEASHNLNNKDTFSAVKERASAIGFKIHEVAYFGYLSEQVQSMHNKAIISRTRRRIDLEKEQQQMALRDYTLSKQTAIDELAHKQERQLVEQELGLKKINHDAKIKMERGIHDLENERKQRLDEEAVAHLRALKETAQVDLTRYLVVRSMIGKPLTTEAK